MQTVGGTGETAEGACENVNKHGAGAEYYGGRTTPTIISDSDSASLVFYPLGLSLLCEACFCGNQIAQEVK